MQIINKQNPIRLRFALPLLLPALFALSCATSAKKQPAETAKTQQQQGEAKGQQKSAADVVSQDETAQRQALQKVFQRIFEVPPELNIGSRILNPKSPEDAQNIVRSDNVALYPRADAFWQKYLPEHPDDLDNQTWHAQMFLAWADSAMLTSKTLHSSEQRLSARRDKLQAGLDASELTGAAKFKAKKQIEEMKWLLPLIAQTRARLDEVAKDKLAQGQSMTRAILTRAPESYQGYRLAADLARITEDWSAYDRAVKKIEQLNPDSNGLRFLRGVVAFSRDKDYKSAEKFLSAAVVHDAKFTKAQYYLALSYLNRRQFDAAQAALERTLTISPGHPFANAVRAYIARARGY